MELRDLVLTRSSSIIAVDLNKDEIIWTFQDVFHDLWDYDLLSTFSR